MKRDTRIVAWTLGAMAMLIAFPALLCSWAISAGASAAWRLPFRIFCHGMAERSLHVFGEAMPICARCFAIYAGLIIGIAVFALWPRIQEQAARMILFLAVFPIGIDGLTQAAGLRVSTNVLRMTTGAAVAIAFAVWALAAVEHRDETAVTTS